MIAGLYAKKKRAQVMGIWNAFIPIGSALGIGLGGIVATRWGWQHAFGLFAALTTLISALILFVALTFCHGALRYTGILLVGLTIIAFLPAAAAITQDVVHPGLRAVSYALCVLIQNLLGSSTGPIVIGSISDARGIEAAMSVLPIALVAGAALFFSASFFYVKDLERVEKVTLQME